MTIRYRENFYGPGCIAAIELCLRRTLVRSVILFGIMQSGFINTGMFIPYSG